MRDKASKEKYKFPTQSSTQSTGYWTFFCNSAKWEIDKFLSSNIAADTYQVTNWQVDSFKPGQVGVIRVGVNRRTKIQLNGRQKLQPGIYAIVEILSEAQKRKDPLDEFWTNWTEAEMEKPVVKIRYLRNLLKSPLPSDRLKQNSSISDKYLLQGFQASSMLLEKSSFDRIIQLIDNGEQIFENAGLDTSETPQDILELEHKYSDAVPEVKEVVSRRIERGPIANKLKKIAGYKCLICRSLGELPYCFKKPNGQYYIEAHHVSPVSQRERGSLGSSNIITVCPNHHRQLHYGNSEFLQDTGIQFVFQIDGQRVEVQKLRTDAD